MLGDGADTSDLGWRSAGHHQPTNPPGGCSHGPPPPVPSPEHDEYDGQFVFFVDKWKVWDYKAGAGRIGICFGGSSIIKLNEEGDKYYDLVAATQMISNGSHLSLWHSLMATWTQ